METTLGYQLPVLRVPKSRFAAVQGRSVGFRSDVSALVPFDAGRMPYTDFILLPTKNGT